MKRMFYKKSSSKLLMELVLTYGELPYPALKVLKKDPYSLEHTAKALLNRRYFVNEVFKSNNISVRSLVLSKETPDDFIGRVYSEAMYHHKKALQRRYHRKDVKTYKRIRSRSLNIAESAAFAVSAEISVFPYEKPITKYKGKNKANTRFYAPWEIKETMEMENARATSGSCTGYIQTRQEYIAMYCMGVGKVKLLQGTERQMRDRIEWQLNNHFSYDEEEYCRLETAVILTPKFDIKSLMVEEKESVESAYDTLKFIFSDVYYFPYTWFGARQMSWVIDQEKRDRLIHLVLPTDCETTVSVDCDGIYKEHFCLVFFVPNLCRLERFRYSATQSNGTGLKYRIYCLDFQEKALKEYLKGVKISIAVVKFDKIYSLMEQKGENT